MDRLFNRRMFFAYLSGSIVDIVMIPNLAKTI